MDSRQRKINRILGTLKQGTLDVRRNPSSENYSRWEAKLARASRDKPTVWALIGAGILFFGVVMVSQLSTSPHKNHRTKSNPNCYLYNDNSDYNVVNIRANCDVKACGYDDSTIIGEYPNYTPVNVADASGRKSGRFTWIQVVLVNNGQVVWVASSKVRC